jgi:hypothetical protein
MSLVLPEMLQRYYASQNAHDVDAMVACFASDAVVRDEGHTYAGADAIRAWKQETSAKYRVAATPLESRIEGGSTLVVVRVSGAFPGSPANLTYRFGLSAAGKIKALEVG